MVNSRTQICRILSILGACSLWMVMPVIAQESAEHLQDSRSQSQQSLENSGDPTTLGSHATQDQSATQAWDPIEAVPNRPTASTTARTVQRGILEVEYGFEGGRGHQDANGLVKFGLLKTLELRFANNPVQRDSGIFGRGDSGAGFKWKFASQHKAQPDIALLYTVAIPTSTNRLGVEASGHSVLALLSKDFGKEHFDVNEGVFFVGRGAPGNGFDRSYFSALSWSRTGGGKWGVTAELAGYSWTNAQTQATMTFLAAPTYTVTPRLVLDAGAYVAPYGYLPRVTFICGLTYSITDLYHPHRSARSAGIVSSHPLSAKNSLEPGNRGAL